MTLRGLNHEADIYWNRKLIHCSSDTPESVKYLYKDVHLNFDQIVLTRGAPGIQDHVVVISLEKRQRTTFNDAMAQPKLTEEKKLYLSGLKYRNIHKPYNDFLLYKNMILFAHHNIISSYDINQEDFLQH